MNKKGNILILSVGRCVELIQGFRTEVVEFSDDIRIPTTDVNSRVSSAYHVSDGAFSVPSIQSEDYIDRIFDLTTEEDVGLIIPTIDTELYKLSEARICFEEVGIYIVISDSELVALCRDKHKTVGLFVRHGIRSPEVYDRNRLVYPCLVKSHNGSRTIGARCPDRAADLMPEVLADSKLMFCQLIDVVEEFQEFIADMYYDRKGRPKCAILRKRLEVRTEEVSKGAVRRNSLYGLLTENMAILGDARSCITAQFSFNERNDALYGMEINPRFGGGFPPAYAASGNYPGWPIREYLCDEGISSSDRWKSSLIMLRYDTKVLVHKQD